MWVAMSRLQRHKELDVRDPGPTPRAFLRYAIKGIGLANFLLRLLLGIVSTTLCLLVLEVGLRIWGTFPMFSNMTAAHPQLDYVNKPLVRERAYWRGVSEYTWTTNSIGLRGSREYRVPKPIGTRRILLLGDSFTFGEGVDDNETFASVMERSLSSHCRIRIEVVNGGVSGYGTSQELKFLELFGPRLQPDLVILNFFVNDAQDNLDKGLHYLRGGIVHEWEGGSRGNIRDAKRAVRWIPGYNGFLRHSALVGWLKAMYAKMRLSKHTFAAVPREIAPQTGAIEAYKWDLQGNLLRAARDVAGRLGADFMVVLIPDWSVVSNSGGTGQETFVSPKDARDAIQRMSELCRRVGLRCFDLTAVFVDRYERGYKDYLDVNLHWNRHGNEAAGQALAECVAQYTGHCLPPEMQGHTGQTSAPVAQSVP